MRQRTMMVWLLLALLSAPPLGLGAMPPERIPSDRGYAGTFSHGADDRFDFGFSTGLRLSVGRRGDLEVLQAGAAISVKDKAGKLLRLEDGQGALCSFAYRAQGQLAAIHARGAGTLLFSYSKGKRVLRIEFPNHQRGQFPTD